MKILLLFFVALNFLYFGVSCKLSTHHQNIFERVRPFRYQYDGSIVLSRKSMLTGAQIASTLMGVYLTSVVTTPLFPTLASDTTAQQNSDLEARDDVGESEPQRVEMSLFGTVAPKTVNNFKSLCKNENGIGYRGSTIFRIISQFSVQGGNVGNDQSVAPSKVSRYGKGSNGPFPAENFRLLHSFETAGVVSMMKDVTNKGLQDSRFFITVKPDASWADGKYTAFGLVTQGMSFIQGLTVIPVEPPSNHPLTPIKIVNSGIYPL